MKIKFFSYVIILVASILAPQIPAHSVPTKWEDVKVSMSDLLNSGWQIIAHGVSRVASSSSTGGSFDQANATFVLSKGGKYIFCVVEDPRPPIARSAACRKLN
jgi:hypothetical protein